jgi:hypothetical protein
VAAPLLGYLITPYAGRAMRRRDISETILRMVLQAPEQRFMVRPGRDVLQSRAHIAGRMYLIRIFADVDRYPPEIVTLYRTSKIAKYWRTEP